MKIINILILIISMSSLSEINSNVFDYYDDDDYMELMDPNDIVVDDKFYNELIHEGVHYPPRGHLHGVGHDPTVIVISGGTMAGGQCWANIYKLWLLVFTLIRWH